MESRSELLEMTTEVVAAYVSANTVSASEVPDLIAKVFSTLSNLQKNDPVPEVVPQAPAVNPKKSITADYIVCLEDGKRFKSLKRHLRTRYNMSPEEYRAKWNLPADYPMVAPNYALARSNLAKEMGLGQKKIVVPPPKGKRGS
jgi:predicted transcriptional regulator